jgi:hypothetical protein
MVSRLMINLRDPKLNESNVRGGTAGTNTNSCTGYISTFVPDSILFAPSTRSDLSKPSLSWSGLRHANMVLGLELGVLDLRQDSAPGSIPHRNS